MYQKGFASAIMVIAIIALVGIGGFVMVNKKEAQPEQKVQPLSQEVQKTSADMKSDAGDSILPVSKTAKQTQQTPVNEQSGAGGSGIPGQVLGAKFCENQTTKVKEAVYGEKLTISSDGKSILLNGKVAISLADLPSTISVSASQSFSATNSKFTSAVLSPAKSYISFTVFGIKSGWGGVFGLSSGIVSPVSVNYDGSVDNPKWNHDGHYVVFSKATPLGVHVLALVNAFEIKNKTSENEKILDFTKIDLKTFMPATAATSPADMNILGPSAFADLYNYLWRDNKDGKVYFTVSVDDTHRVYADVWSVGTNDLKWQFVCGNVAPPIQKGSGSVG